MKGEDNKTLNFCNIFPIPKNYCKKVTFYNTNSLFVALCKGSHKKVFFSYPATKREG